MMDSILIQNGVVYDGTGAPGRKTNILVKGSKIVQMDTEVSEAQLVIDAAGRVVCPGFVDIHRHCDAKPLCGTDFGMAELRQGITTVVAGNCGISLTPCDPQNPDIMDAFMEPVLGRFTRNGIFTYRDYLSALGKVPLPVNFAAMIGTGAVRITCKGFSDTPYTAAELAQARALVEDALAQGAPGISLGIMYLPECYGNADEYAYILEPAARYGRVVTAHIRGEGDSVTASVQELLDIGQRAGCAVHISHFKACGVHNWRREIHRAIALLEEARANGQDVTCDFYPYEGGSTALTTMLPPAFIAGDLPRALRRLGTPEGVADFRAAAQKQYDGWDNFAITLGWERIIVSGVTRAHNRKFLGKTISQAAQDFGFADDIACAAYLCHDEEGRAAIINMSMCQDDIDTIARLPYSFVISDAIYTDTDTPHPRMFGAFPKILREYVRARGVYTLPEAIRRMTRLPAERMGLRGRGALAEGHFADINIFDPESFLDNATFDNPARMAAGLAYCIVNGRVAIQNDVRTNHCAGALLTLR